jgi:hypothetical protein
MQYSAYRLQTRTDQKRTYIQLYIFLPRGREGVVDCLALYNSVEAADGGRGDI